MNSYQEGDVVYFNVVFRNAITGAAVDPATVTFSYQLNSTASSTPVSFTGSTTPAPGVVAKIGVGRYQFQVSIAGMSGTLTAKVVSTGVGQATATDTITIIPNPF